jgi:peptidoglycan/LPS O-acetylase OafA/YrhL
VTRFGFDNQYLSIGRRAGAIPELDGLRGIAILLVMLRHAAYPINKQHGEILPIGSWDLAVPLLNGWMGVDLFFVLSGFLITLHLLKRWPSTFNSSFALRYWGKRILRTFPAYYAAVLIALFGIIPMFAPDVQDPVHTLIVHGMFMQDYLGSDLVAAFWSLGVEEKFYLICPMVLYWVRKLPTNSGVAILIALALLPAGLRILTVIDSEALLLNYQAFFWTVRSPFHLAMDGLWIGVICALIYHRDSYSLKGNNRFARILCYMSLTMLVAVMFSIAWFDDLYFLPSAIVLNLISFCFGALLLSVCIGETPVNAVLRSMWLRILSVLSYSVYLVHMMLVPLALEVTSRVYSGESASALVHFLVFLPVFIILSLFVGALLHFSVEKPFLILKDRIRL